MLTRYRISPVVASILALVLTTLAPASTSAQTTTPKDSIHWVGLEQGFASAKETGKPVFLWFYGDWCGYCKKMTETVFPDSSIIASLNTNFVPIRVLTSSTKKIKYMDSTMTEADFAMQKFNARRVPSTWFVEPDGCRILHLRGFRPVSDLAKNLEFVRTKQYGKCENVPVIDPQENKPKVRFLPDTTKAPAAVDSTKK
jgi:thioredoxin 1